MRHNTSLAIAQPPPPNIVVMPGHDEPTPPPPRSPASAGRVSLAGIGKKTTASGTKQKTYPVAPQTPDTIKLVDFLVEHMPFVDAVDTGKKDLASIVTPFYFGNAAGRAEVESSVIAKGTKDELMVVFPKQLVGAVDEAALAPILGDKVHTLFRPKWELKIDGDKIPGPLAQQIVNEISAVFERHGLGGENGALTASEKFVPLEVFHLQRHTLLTKEQNLALNGIARIKTSIKLRK